jgi:hypothetical protein
LGEGGKGGGNVEGILGIRRKWHTHFLAVLGAIKGTREWGKLNFFEIALRGKNWVCQKVRKLIVEGK